MGKAESFQDLSLMPPREGQELWRWLYDELRAAILDGRLKPGARMPSTRSLAQQYTLSRGTVTAAFEYLQSEGYLTTQVGSGTFVAGTAPDASFQTPELNTPAARETSQATIAKRTLALTEGLQPIPASRSVGKAFRSYEPAIDLFPVNLWSRVAGRVLRRAPRSLYGNGDACGYLPLRRAIAEYLGPARAVRCDPEQIVITSGAQQGLDLVARLLFDPGDAVWMEDPGYPGALLAFRSAGAAVEPVPIDASGLDVAAARRRCPNARVAYTTPANQFPLGVTMTLERRRELLDWASSAQAWIVEDDYDAEYRYSGQPVAALQTLDQTGCVIYSGTFTKLLFNSLRLGFLVLPPRLVDPFAALKGLADRHAPTLEQAVLAEFILDGHFGHHIRRMRQAYAERMEVLVEAARQRLSGGMEVRPAIAGMRTIGWIQTGESDLEVARRGRALGLELAAVSNFTLRHSAGPALMLGFAGCAPAELRRGVRVLASALEAPSASSRAAGS